MSQQQRIGPGARATTILASPNGGFTNITYHQTVVVSFSDSAVILRSGGYRTATTKTRMNQASNQFGLGYSVYQEKGDWYVRLVDRTLPFEDGMVISR